MTVDQIESQRQHTQWERVQLVRAMMRNRTRLFVAESTTEDFRMPWTVQPYLIDQNHPSQRRND